MRKELNSDIKKLISENRIGEALELVQNSVALSENKYLQNSVLALLGRFNALQKRSDKGLTTDETYQREISKLIDTLLSLTDKLQEESVIQSTPSSKVSLAKFFQDKVGLVAVSLFGFFLSISYLLYSSDIYRYDDIRAYIFHPFGPDTPLFYLFVASGFFFIALFRFLNNYLNFTLFKADSKKVIQNTEANHINPINFIENVPVLSEEDKKELFPIIEKKLTKNLLETFKEKTEKALKGEVRYDNLLSNFTKIEQRLLNEISSLNKKANLNLIIGVITSSIALIFLIFVSLSLNESFTDWLSFISHYFPRLALVIFVEIFSFYFLKLYRTNLNEIQYYQNEMTEIEFKILSLKTALLSDDEDNLKTLINHLIHTSKNTILKKDETTIDLKRHEIDNSFHKELIDKLLQNTGLIGIKELKPKDPKTES